MQIEKHGHSYVPLIIYHHKYIVQKVKLKLMVMLVWALGMLNVQQQQHILGNRDHQWSRPRPNMPRPLNITACRLCVCSNSPAVTSTRKRNTFIMLILSLHNRGNTHTKGISHYASFHMLSYFQPFAGTKLLYTNLEQYYIAGCTWQQANIYSKILSVFTDFVSSKCTVCHYI